jgi:cell wall-associated NlpC family hydrolase
VPRLAILCALILFVLVAPAAEAASVGGPVFAVAPSGSAGHDSLEQAIRRRLKATKSALLASRRRQRSSAAQLRRAEAKLVRSGDPFPIQDQIGHLRQALAAEQSRTAGFSRSIKRLNLALKPVALPADFTSSSSSAVGSYAVSIAERYLDVRYVWGGSNPDSGFDCSGFVQYVYAQLGVKLPHYAASQYKMTLHVDPAQLQPGDLVFFEPRADGPGHVGMYVGNDLIIDAPHTGDVVKFERLSDKASRLGFVGASRPAF